LIQTETELRGTTRTAERQRRQPPGSAYWLISRAANSRVEVLTLEHEGEETLPVFSYEEEAEMFLRFGNTGGGWRTTESRAGGLISVLYGPCARVKRVALDPLPEMISEMTVDLVSLPRRRFVERVLTETGGKARRSSRKE
jgi:hypothetical protein